MIYLGIYVVLVSVVGADETFLEKVTFEVERFNQCRRGNTFQAEEHNDMQWQRYHDILQELKEAHTNESVKKDKGKSIMGTKSQI